MEGIDHIEVTGACSVIESYWLDKWGKDGSSLTRDWISGGITNEAFKVIEEEPEGFKDGLWLGGAEKGGI